MNLKLNESIKAARYNTSVITHLIYSYIKCKIYYMHI